MRTLMLTLALWASADVIDRVAVSVENAVIAESEIFRQIRLTALFNDVEPEYTPARKRETAERLVEQMLIRREIGTTRYMSEDEKAYLPLYEGLKKRVGTAWDATLRRYRVTDDEVREALRWQATLLSFVSIRFRPGVQASETDIAEYYDLDIATQPGAPSFEQIHDQIESLLTEQRVNAALDRWLGQTRTQTRIRYREEVFR